MNAGELDVESVAQLRASVFILARRMRNQVSGGELSATEFSTLGRIRRDGPQTPGELARCEHVKAPSMTRVVERLEKAAYLRRDADPKDGRRQLISLTDGGRKFVEQTRQQRSRWLSAQLDQLTDAERAAIEAALPALHRLAELP
ncbi:MAG: MarR family winged helix-turn-helix transcriptional regulator [Nakamurella sp.]